MDSITGILMVAVYIGIVLVLAAMALNMYTHARHKDCLLYTSDAADE